MKCTAQIGSLCCQTVSPTRQQPYKIAATPESYLKGVLFSIPAHTLPCIDVIDLVSHTWLRC